MMEWRLVRRCAGGGLRDGNASRRGRGLSSMLLHLLRFLQRSAASSGYVIRQGAGCCLRRDHAHTASAYGEIPRNPDLRRRPAAGGVRPGVDLPGRVMLHPACTFVPSPGPFLLASRVTATFRMPIAMNGQRRLPLGPPLRRCVTPVIGTWADDRRGAPIAPFSAGRPWSAGLASALLTDFGDPTRLATSPGHCGLGRAGHVQRTGHRLPGRDGQATQWRGGPP
jgi:hypothetical protein